MRRMALIAFLAAALPSPMMAQFTDGPPDCRFDRDIAKILRYKDPSTIAAYAGGAVQYCVGKRTKPTAGWLYDPPRKNQLGLCISRRDDIGLHFDEGGPYEPKRDSQFGRTAPQFLLQPTAGDCPALGDPGYVRSLNVPDGVFLGLFDLWTRVRSSRETFRSLMAHLPLADRDMIAIVERDLFDEATGPHMRLDSVFPTYGIFLDDSDRTRRSTAYDLRILDDRDPLEWYSLHVDWTPEGFVAVGLKGEAI